MHRAAFRTHWLLLALVTTAACTIERGDVRTPSGQPPEADTAAVRKAIEATARAFETGDLASLDTIYHDSVLVFESGGIDRGWLSYRNEHLAPELEVLSDRRFDIEGIRIRIARTTAWATFRFTLEATRDGKRISASGVGTMVFQKLRGRWRLVHSHTSIHR